MGGAEATLEADEAEAMLKVGRAMSQRAMAVGEGKLGGFGIPIQIDPTIILTSSGVTSTLRQKARVVTITTSEWKGVSSAGPAAHFHKEAEEAADDSFEVAQPAIKAERADCFVPFSYEISADYVGFQQEIGRVMADAKNTLETTKYTLGSGTNEPAGIVTGATEVAETSEAGKLKIADVYSAQEALPARFQEGASWLSSLAVANATYRLVGGGNTTEPPLWNDAGDRLLMKPWAELSTMETKIETGKLIAIYGDIAAGFTIVDRLKMSVELIPNLMGENRRPTGQRGLFAYWRTGSKVVNKAALRTQKVK